MLVYSLLQNPSLIPDVDADVEKLLRENGLLGGLLTGWNWVKCHTGVGGAESSGSERSAVAA
jgi:hypothetical protein